MTKLILRLTNVTHNPQRSGIQSQSGVLREDLNLRGFPFLRSTCALAFTLSITNYGNYQFFLPPFFVSKNLHETYNRGCHVGRFSRWVRDWEVFQAGFATSSAKTSLFGALEGE